MKKLTILSVLILSGYTSLFAQDELPKPKRWSFSLSGGAAIPVGSYGKNDAVNAAIYLPDRPDAPIRYIIGFDKAKSGFAKTGYYYNADVQFKFNSGIFLSLRVGQINNPVQENVLSDFLTELSNGEVKVEHVDYSIFYIMPGIGYAKQFNNFDVGLSVFAGTANCNYPYYKGILLFTTTDPPEIWAHDGKRPNLNAFMIGSLLHLDYNITPKFAIGFEVMYQKADFGYEMTIRTIPGGSQNSTIEDIIKLNVVNIGIKIGYRF